MAGRRAEEQIAHYLRRFFGKRDDVDVLHGLRIELDGEVAQMDHLVLHPYGMLIVESKSVSGKVQIKDDGQWVRWYADNSKGMRSPIKQAQMQGLLLRDLLSEKVKQKGVFDNVGFDVLVAVSDEGLILWPKEGPLPEVCKADQVPDRIEAHIQRLRAAGHERPLLTPEYLRVIGSFLSMKHKPLIKAVTPTPFIQEPVATYLPPKLVETSKLAVLTSSKVQAKHTLPERICKSCQSSDLELTFARSYYFRCRACDKNTGIKFGCPSCGGEGRIRKQGKDFFAECKSCDASVLYHSN
ncbi:MAG: hypothetical protein RL211_1985 [Pseudomonadota bacterium]|jgi:hypothetical protein